MSDKKEFFSWRRSRLLKLDSTTSKSVSLDLKSYFSRSSFDKPTKEGISWEKNTGKLSNKKASLERIAFSSKGIAVK